LTQISKSGRLAIQPPYVLPLGGLVSRRNATATNVTSKGQVTIPEPIRDRPGIKPGDAEEFELAPDGRVQFKVGGERRLNRFEALRGRAGAGLSTDEIMALTRGEE
jgi:AbrB family looped-hinge helix DNA binding protein